MSNFGSKSDDKSYSDHNDKNWEYNRPHQGLLKKTTKSNTNYKVPLQEPLATW